MDWTQQMEEMGKQWADMQKKLWLGWSDAAQQATATAQSKAMWQQLLDTWKNVVYRTLEMQVESARLWSESVTARENGEQAVQWAQQFYQMTKQSSAVQKQLWDGWFQMMEKLDPRQVQTMMDMSNQPVNFWKEMSQQTLNMQQEWLKNWTAWPPSKGR
ncbi:MAG: hypothetical protein KF832_22500 [Caldilineaceae bacterium]|nr:hypothetical protein [Caldilineaceae bacterium]